MGRIVMGRGGETWMREGVSPFGRRIHAVMERLDALERRQPDTREQRLPVEARALGQL